MQLQGALLDSAQLQGASLVGAQLQGASLFLANLQGASLYGAQLQSALLDAVSVWRASNMLADFEGALVNLDPNERKPCTEPADQICGWSSASLRHLDELITATMPAGGLRDIALKTIHARLDPGVPLHDERRWAETWAAVAKSPPTQAVYEMALAQQWAQIGCQAYGAPYVLHALVRTIRDRFSPGSSELPALAAKFLGRGCTGAEGLAAADRSILQQLQDQAASKPATAAHQP